ncbi:unnamed protein product [Rodentolepis nana]|uniref:Calponin-homology (CH) domain-containing protein n=1 Tax=Rodentolepis nana TaxID=102285 RepID=A0A0R3TFX8_RODNA|nr:unnamed protein product [Rodentolepis nana]
MLEPHSKEQPLIVELIQKLIEWINKELIDERILVRDIEADLYDGQVLQKLIEKLTGESLNQPELTQTEMGQKQRLRMVLEEINNVLGVPEVYAAQNWPVAAIFSKDLVATLRLLVALVHRFAPDFRLPAGCQLTLVIVRKLNGVLQHRRQIEVITEMTDATGKDGIHLLHSHSLLWTDIIYTNLSCDSIAHIVRWVIIITKELIVEIDLCFTVVSC